MSRLIFCLLFAGATSLLFACSSDPSGGAEPHDGDAGTGGSGGSGSTPSATGGVTGSGGLGLSGGSTGTGGSTSSAIPGGSTVDFDGTRFRASIFVEDVAPGDEEHVCVVVELPNTEQAWVDDIVATLEGGSHHLIVDRQDVGTGTQTEPVPCSPTMAGDETRLIIAQQAETQVTLPEGTAFSLEPRQPIFLQLHYFNSATEPVDIHGVVDMNLAPAGEAPIEAKSMFTGSFTISIPPNAAGKSESFITPMASTGTRHVFALTSHTHKLGVRSTIERVASESAPTTTPIHESLDWAEPPLSFFDPPLAFDGSDGLRLICNYQNTTNQPVSFGTGVDQEMCFMWIYYFDR